MAIVDFVIAVIGLGIVWSVSARRAALLPGVRIDQGRWGIPVRITPRQAWMGAFGAGLWAFGSVGTVGFVGWRVYPVWFAALIISASLPTYLHDRVLPPGVK